MIVTPQTHCRPRQKINKAAWHPCGGWKDEETLSLGVALSMASSWPFRLCGVDMTASTESELANVTKPMPRCDCLDASFGIYASCEGTLPISA